MDKNIHNFEVISLSALGLLCSVNVSKNNNVDMLYLFVLQMHDIYYPINYNNALAFILINLTNLHLLTAAFLLIILTYRYRKVLIVYKRNCFDMR